MIDVDHADEGEEKKNSLVVVLSPVPVSAERESM
jgi:hypothetical protein